jgi:hypothetical protein
MSVTLDCRANELAVKLLLGQQQQLRYVVVAQGDLVCTLRSERQITLLPDPLNPVAVERIWPRDASEVPGGTHVVHRLGIVFGQAGQGSVQLRVEKICGAATLEVVKDCTYTSREGGDNFFDNIHIYPQ